MENKLVTEFQDPQFSEKANPKTVTTALGLVEYVDIGSGPAVVTLHGAMGGYDQSIILAQAIGEEGFRYLAMTRPGYLGTPISSGKTPEQQGDLIAALLDKLNIDKAGVLAVSGGGPSAVEFGIRHPERCTALVLVATCAHKVETSIPFSFKLMIFLARIPWFVNKFRKKAEQDLAAVAKLSIQDPIILERTINDPDTWPLFSTLLLSTYNKMGQRIIGTDNDIEITQTATYPLENLSIPVLAIHGTKDKLVQYDIHAKMYESRVPNIELLTIEEGEHVAIFTHRIEVRKKVSNFMRHHFKR